MNGSEFEPTTATAPNERYRAMPDQTPSEAVVTAVSEASGRALAGTESLDPLYHAIDPDALDALFDTYGDAESTTSVEFVYGGYEVTVEGSGLVTLHPGE